MNVTKIIAAVVLVSAVLMLGGCAISYQPAPYKQHLWALAESHGYENAFHTHIRGHGMCAVVLTAGVSSSQWGAKWEAEHRGVKFFNSSLNTIIGDIIIADNPTFTVDNRVYRREDGQWRADVIVASPLE